MKVLVVFAMRVMLLMFHASAAFQLKNERAEIGGLVSTKSLHPQAAQTKTGPQAAHGFRPSQPAQGQEEVRGSRGSRAAASLARRLLASIRVAMPFVPTSVLAPGKGSLGANHGGLCAAKYLKKAL